MTEWPLFRTPDFEVMKSKMKKPIIFDGRNLFDPKEVEENGFTYHSVGRRPVHHV
jgi:UDPglucose 6-dehydrogenase